MGGMVVQDIVNIIGNKISKLICYGTGPIGEVPGRFETMDQSIKRLKSEGLQATSYRIAKTWFKSGEKDKYFYLCSKAAKKTNLESANNALLAMKNWNGIKNLKKIKNQTLIIWGDQDKSYNFNQADALNKNIKNSELKIFKGCSHNTHLEIPDEFNHCVADFLLK